jgi:ADP-ribosyl-[dinitrogen reductase] hydrolase
MQTNPISVPITGLVHDGDDISASQLESIRNRFKGLLLGTAVGDALGLPAEGLSKRRVQKLFPGRWRNRFLFQFGMVSDDTDHTVFVAQCLLASNKSLHRFTRRFAWCLRFWLLSLPASIGGATLKSGIRLLLGIKPESSGVYSAGSGAAMRSAVIGAYFSSDPVNCRSFVKAATEITHTDPKAFVGASAVALVSGWIIREDISSRPSLEDFEAIIKSADNNDPIWSDLTDKIVQALSNGLSVQDFVATIGLQNGVSGYVYHVVPVALFAWYRHFGDFESALNEVLSCGGDTDTVGAITGALVGAVVGENGIPADWIKGMILWPLNCEIFRSIGKGLAEQSFIGGHAAPIRYFWPWIFARNLLFFLVVLAHIARRLLPPYSFSA